MLYRYGLRLGLQALVEGHVRWAIPLMVRPVNYWRTVEYAAVGREAAFTPDQSVLDIGSPKLLALYLAEQGLRVSATDINSYFVAKLSYLRMVRRIPRENLDLIVCDGRETCFADASFDVVYSISVIEHIAGDGDSACMREIARVVKPGGRCVITVPFAAESRMEYTSRRFYWAERDRGSREAFYQRRYSEEDLRRRLIEPSGLRLRRLQYIGERIPTPRGKELDDYLPAISGPLQPLLSRVLHTRPTSSWRELRKPLCAVISLDREGDSSVAGARSKRDDDSPSATS